MSNNLIDNKPTEIVNNDDEDDKNDTERIDNEAKNVNDNSDGATIRRRRIRKQRGAGGPASNATHHGEQAVYSQVGS